MARRYKRFNLPGPLRIGNLIVVLLCLFLFWGAFSWLRSFVDNAAYFKVEKVQIDLIGKVPLTDRTVRDLLTVGKGTNIFDVNLKATRDYILSNYPEIRTLVINRVFPNKLSLTIRPRRPVAQASLGASFYLLDSEGVILPGVKRLIQEGLPIISGIDARYVPNSVGKKCECPGLKKALSLLEIMNQSGFSGEHEISMIEVSDEKNLSFYIEGGIEIKIGSEDFRQRLIMLKRTFSSARLDKSQIKYIDLRFGNVIIGPK